MNTTEMLSTRQELAAISAPDSADEALAILEFISAATQEGERLKKLCYAVLNEAAPEGIYQKDGVTFVRVKGTKTVWNKTPELMIAEVELKKAQENLDTVRRAGGFETVPGADYWQRKKEEEA